MEVALAKAAGPGTKRSILIRVLDWKSLRITRKQFVTEQVSVVEDGKEVVKNVRREVDVVSMKTEVTGFREVNLSAKGFHAHTVEGKSIPNARLIQLLKEERPVLLFYGDTVEPYHVATTKTDTVFLRVKCTQVYPEAAGFLGGGPETLPK